MTTPTLRDPILIVSGLPRSGTSMMMSMLGAGGIELLTDGIRAPDADNPLGYFEFEATRSLACDSSWLGAAGGKAVKVISPLLHHLPSAYAYRVLFMRRDVDEILASQETMLARRGAPKSVDAQRLRDELCAHLAMVTARLRSDPAFQLLDVSYRDVIDAPDEAIARIVAFVNRPLDVRAMRACVDPGLYRARRGSQVP